MNDSSSVEFPPLTPDGSLPAPEIEIGHDAAGVGGTPTRRVRHRRRRGLLARTRARAWPYALALLLIILVAAIWGGSRAYAGWRAYQSARSDLDRLQTQARVDPGTVSATNLATMHSTFQDLSFDLRRMDQTLTTTGVQPVLEHLPWIAPRYRAAQQLLSIGELLASAGDSGSAIAEQTLTAFQQNGVMANDKPSTSNTWVDVVTQHQADIQRVAAQVSQAQQLRASLNTALLPAQARARLPVLDKWLNRYDVTKFANQDLPAIETALGASQEQRYLVLFQNPEELRPAGGFPGTIALVTVRRGQVTSYQFSDIKVLTADYMAQRPSKLPQPWPIEQYFPQDGFLIQDATWFADFPRAGAQFMSMYSQTNWPAINGVVAVEPAAVSDVLKVIGPVTVDVDGEPRTITAANVLDEVERQRRLQREGEKVDLKHKQVLELIGEEIINHVKAGNRAELIKIAKNLKGAANVRDIQAYSPNQQVESMLDARYWSGRLLPQPGEPTLAVTFANLVLVKDSLRMQSALNLKLGPVQDGRREATLTVTLKNTGTNAEDPYYAGFQKWWVQVALPQDSTLVGTDPAMMPDPDAPNGGSYKLDLFPQQTGVITLKFTMPASGTLLVRRQPGITPASVIVDGGTCSNPTTTTVPTDTTVALPPPCH